MPTITMRIGENMIELSQDGSALPPDLQHKFDQELRYVHLTQLRGVDAYDNLGNYRPTRSEVRLLSTLDSRGRFVASLGWQYRLKRNVRAAGYGLHVVDIRPTHPRPDRYAVNWDRLFERMELKVKQDLILAAMERCEHGLIDVPPGVGKTFLIGAYALAHPNARIHVITDGIDILQRIYRHLVKYIPNVGMVGGGKRRFGRVTVISADSLHVIGEGFNDPHSPSSPDVVIFDEVHKAGATTILSNLAKYQCCKMYGLSGSLDSRFDGADVQLEGLFGEKIFTMSYQEAEGLGLVAPIVVDWVSMDFSAPEMADLKQHKLEKVAIWNNYERNRRFAEKMRSFSEDTQCLVLVSKAEHAVRLQHFLPDFKLCYDQMEHYDKYVKEGALDPVLEPRMDPRRREQMRRDFEEMRLMKVIATDVWSTGVDFVGLPVVGRADARDSRILDAQIPGRANRIYEGKPHAVLVDCMDGFHGTLLRRSNGRKRAYIGKGWKQEGLLRRRIGVRTAKQNRG